MKKRSTLPLVVLVAAVALVLGSFGTAVAGPALTKGAVKSIAKKVVNKAAPSLSVAHATTADKATTATSATTATTATNATNATNAAQATNSTNLNGLAASAYQDRVAFATNIGSVALAAGSVDTEVIGATPITVQANVGFLSITGSTSMTGNSFNSAWVAIDTACTNEVTTAFDARNFNNPVAGEASVNVSFTAAVSAGAHTVRLCARAGVAGAARGSSLTVHTVATGHTGTSSLRPSNTPGADGNPDSPR